MLPDFTEFDKLARRWEAEQDRLMDIFIDENNAPDYDPEEEE